MSFPVVLSDPVLVLPAAPTPRETKRLSDIDKQDVLRGMPSYIGVYRGGQPGDRAPGGVIRRAVAEVLVPYYPLAGRLREMEGRKLVVECTGEGVPFVEAEAGTTLEEVQAAGVRTRFPWLEKRMPLVGGSSDVLNSPLLHIQVTRFKCGSFVLAIRFNHTLCDGVGLTYFISTVAKLARGGTPEELPAVAAPWARQLLVLDARLTPKPVLLLPRLRERCLVAVAPTTTTAQDELRPFSFSSGDIALLRKNLGSATVFQVVAAFVWRCRCVALSIPPGQDVSLVFPLDLRRMETLRLPAGYYGNAFTFVSAVLPAGLLCSSTLGDVVQVLQQAKRRITGQHVRSAPTGRPDLTKDGMFLLTDHRHVGFHRLDLGWGKPVYGGLTAEAVLPSATFVIGVQDLVVVPLMLPPHAMERFSYNARTWLQQLRSPPSRL